MMLILRVTYTLKVDHFFPAMVSVNSSIAILLCKRVPYYEVYLTPWMLLHCFQSIAM